VKVGLVNLSEFVGGAERELLDHATAMRDDHGTAVFAIIESRNVDLAAMLDACGVSFASSDFRLERDQGVSSRGFGNVWRIFQQARRLRAVAKQHALDLVISYSYHSGIVAALARLLGMKAKLVVAQVTRRDLTRGGLMEHLPFLAADGMTYNSNAMRLSFEPIARRYSRPERVVYSYVKKPALEGKRNERERLIAEHGLGADTTIVGYFGHIFKYKRVADVVDAVGLLNAAAPGKFFLVVIGSSSTPSEYETHVRALAEAKCPGRHRFLKFADDPFPLMAACSVVVQPSIEPFGRVLVEAMYLGVPFVATDAGGPKEIMSFADARCGKLVPSERPDLIAEAITTLMKNRPAVRPPVHHLLTREGIVGGAVQFYQEVLADRRPARSGLLRSALPATVKEVR
jgi:glycosyltransferase involved in cell wall biosynthesis